MPPLRHKKQQSKKMTKLLAALDLVQVGNIKLVETPEPGGAIVGWLAVGGDGPGGFEERLGLCIWID